MNGGVEGWAVVVDVCVGKVFVCVVWERRGS